ncbi:hypothetical protein [Corynebacterium coyleae]|uniref:hypothetical protein n=1 Tax=Corynebacterium coyleae TaxID=53374 RepID=UPI00255038CF|nr:hypothetical protein [Corynebacterium coyleae]MDK8663944.1 hypothetical protein [Corynebacterium coyleae]MDK8706899.1 hypothetical protein [Corynebacterium coyleae]MDK8733746.1 hypothetical protein [Corynebacterium coyleae]MDK8892942.1 hypothetical protein [Corynebacterium coyleae]
MADKQLTVAELLARAEKENPSATRRPRRRRSLEDGGVSVAELTDSFKKVNVKPVEAKHSSVPIDAPAEPAKTVKQEKPEEAVAKAKPTQAPPAEDDTHVIPVVREGAAKPAGKPAEKPAGKLAEKPVEKPAEKPAAQATAPAAAAAAVAAPQSEEKPVEEVVVDKQDAELDLFENDLPDEDVRDIEVEDASINPILMVLLVGLGVLLGVLGFLAFKWLWAHVIPVVAVLLGIVAVVGVVFGVRAMRTGRDGLNMALAGIAAAVMAFGPALI